MFDEILGLGATVVGGTIVGSAAEKTTHAVLGTKEGEDELADVTASLVGLGASLAAGDAIFDLFTDDDD